MKEQTNLISENRLKVYVTDLKDKFLKPEESVILYTSDDFGKTLSIQLKDIQITLDYNELKKIVGE